MCPLDTRHFSASEFIPWRFSRDIGAGYVERGQVARLVSLVSRFGEIAVLESFGFADIEAGGRMQPDTLFRIYSMTKPITSVTVRMQLEEGCFRLTDRISDYLPMFRETELGIPLAIRNALDNQEPTPQQVATLPKQEGGRVVDTGFISRNKVTPKAHL